MNTFKTNIQLKHTQLVTIRIVIEQQVEDLNEKIKDLESKREDYMKVNYNVDSYIDLLTGEIEELEEILDAIEDHRDKENLPYFGDIDVMSQLAGLTIIKNKNG